MQLGGLHKLRVAGLVSQSMKETSPIEIALIMCVAAFEAQHYVISQPE
jgi:hypothetical protein